MSTLHLSVLGTAITQFGELWDQSLAELFISAMQLATTDAQLKPSEVEAVFVANKAGGSFENQSHLNALVSQHFPHFPPSVRIEAACASGGAALLAAENALLAGQYQTVLVVGAEKMTDVSAEETTQILSSAANTTAEFGSTFPALYALIADAYLRKHHLNSEVLAAVAVKNHRHALSNLNAQFRKELTLEQVMASPVIAPPLRVLDCSPITDGAAAVVLSTSSRPAKAQIIGYGHAQDTFALADRAELTEFRATQRAAQAAYQMASIIPDQIDVAEVHDCFTIAEVVALADLGLFSQKQAAQAAITGASTYGGKVLINPSGGLKACGHPVGATGVKQVAYLSRLLAEGKYRTALAQNVGGAGGTAVVHILAAVQQKGSSYV